MKKLALLIVLMTVIALTSYAVDIPVSINCSSELVFGVNFNDTDAVTAGTQIASGFKNNNTMEVDFTLVEGDAEKGKPEDGAVYGWIKLTNYSMKADNMAWKTGDNGDVEAKIIFPSGWVKISGTNNSLNYVLAVQDDDTDNDNADKGISDALTANGGLVLGLNFAPVAIEVGIFSETDWTVDNNYGVNLKATVDVAPIKVEGGFEMGLNHSDTTMGAGAKLSATLTPLTVYAGIDVLLGEPAPATTVMEYGFGASIAIAGITVTADGSYNENVDGFDVRAKIDAGGLVAGLGLALTVELFNMTGAVGADTDAAMEYAVIVDASFATATMKPYANVRYSTYLWNNDTDTYTYNLTGDEVLALKLGCEFYVIPNVTFTLEYASSDLSANTSGAAIDNGTIQFKTKIAL